MLSATILLKALPVNPSPVESRCPVFANSVDPDQLASEEAN